MIVLELELEGELAAEVAVATLEVTLEVVVAVAALLVAKALEVADAIGVASFARQNLTPCAGMLTPFTLVE